MEEYYKLIVDVVTGEQVVVPLTLEEIADMEQRIAEAQQENTLEESQ